MGKARMPPDAESRPVEPALFAQDKWKVLPNLTVSYGLRWDAQVEPPVLTSPSQVFFAR